MKLVTLMGVLLTATSLWADQITLKNGDRYTGSIVSANANELVLETSAAAKITIKRAEIEAISSDGPIYVDLVDGQSLSGALQTVNNQLRVGTTNVALADVKEMRNQAEEAKAARYRNPRMIDLWGGFFDFGFAGARGNANTTTFNLNTRANRVTNRDKISIYFTSIFASNDTTGIQQTTANAKRGGVTYDLNLNEKWFAWGAADFEADQFQSLDLRIVPAGGIGHHTISTDATKLDLRAGVSGSIEYFSTGLRRNFFEAMLGNDFVHDFSKTTSIQQHLRIFPNLTDAPNARINFDLAFITALKNWLSVQLTFSDRYLSNPLPDRRQNDMLFSAGVRLTWGLQ